MLDLSVIVPVHNGGQRFRECIESVLAQTMDRARMEVILVNDGSTDDTDAYCDQLAQEYPGFFRVLHRNTCSGHCSTPRNDGLDLAQGTYVLFFDADDLLLPQACERMVANALAWDSDVVVLRAELTWEDGRRRVVPGYCADGRPSIPDAFAFSDFCVNAEMDCRRLLRRSLLLEHGLRFEPTVYEDVALIVQALAFAKRVSVANDYTYYQYRKWEGGTNLTSKAVQIPEKSFDGRMHGVRTVLEFIEAQGLADAAYPYLHRKIFGHMVYNIITTAMDHRSWTEEVPRMAELRQLVEGHWNSGLGALLPFEKQAVLEALMAGCYEDLPLVRTVGKILLSPEKRAEFVEQEQALEPACAAQAFERFGGMSTYAKRRLVSAQLMGYSVKNALLESRLLGSTFSATLATRGEVASLSAAEVQVRVRGQKEPLVFPVEPGKDGSFQVKCKVAVKNVSDVQLRIRIGNDVAKYRIAYSTK